MEDRIQKAVELFKSGYNCSQSVVAAFADMYGFTQEQALRMGASFGGGIGRMRETCGAACGMFLVAGLETGATEATDREGIDIEKARKGRQNLAKRFFDISEAEWIKECDSDQRFFRIWTLKEAYGKATGQGVLDILDKIVYRLEKGKMKAYMCGLPQNFTIVEKEFDGFSLSVIQL